MLIGAFTGAICGAVLIPVLMRLLWAFPVMYVFIITLLALALFAACVALLLKGPARSTVR
jgi:hypothetical protein